MILNKQLLHALWLNSDESVLLYMPLNSEKSTPESLIKDILNMLIITTKRLFVIKHYYVKRTVEITESFYFDKINEFKISMQHAQNSKALLYLSATKFPMLSISTINNSYDFLLKGILFKKKKINRIAECVKTANPKANIIIDYTRDNLAEAYTEILFDKMDNKNKLRAKLLMVLLMIILSMALWRLIDHIRIYKI